MAITCNARVSVMDTDLTPVSEDKRLEVINWMRSQDKFASKLLNDDGNTTANGEWSSSGMFQTIEETSTQFPELCIFVTVITYLTNSQYVASGIYFNRICAHNGKVTNESTLLSDETAKEVFEKLMEK